ncbi:MAG: LptF/LptG family permease [Alphaproteobacteria bacterium]|nr:LptF/LptG family permease [Alphaproteobacteria bacterium]
MMKPNSILGTYLIKQTVMCFLGVLGVICAIIMMFDMIEILRRTSGRYEVSIGFLIQYVVAKLPETVDKVVPFIVMISTMITFWRISKSNEFVIIRAAGVSIWGVLSPVLLAVFMIGVLWIMVVNPFSAKMFELRETLSYRLSTNNPNAFLFSNKGLWIREGKDDNVVAIINASNLNLKDDVLWLHDVSVIEVDERTQVKRRIEAFVATLEDGNLNLKDVRIYKSGQKAEIVSSMLYPTEMNIQRIRDNFVDPEAISFWNLPDTIDFYEASGFSVLRYKMRYISLLALPFMLMAMVLVAGIFSLKASQRQGGVLWMIIFGIATGFTVYFTSQVISAFGLNSYIPVWFAVWAPTIIVASVSISVYLHKEE